MHDILIMAGTAVIGGLILDIQRRLSSRQQILAGTALLPLGWILMLGMSGSGPIPLAAGAALGCGILLTGVVLLTLPAARALRTRHSAAHRRKV